MTTDGLLLLIFIIQILILFTNFFFLVRLAHYWEELTEFLDKRDKRIMEQMRK